MFVTDASKGIVIATPQNKGNIMSKMGWVLVAGIATFLFIIGFLIGSINGPYWILQFSEYQTIWTGSFTISGTILAALIAAWIIYWKSGQDLENQKKAVLNILKSELVNNREYIQSHLNYLQGYHEMIQHFYEDKTEVPLLIIFKKEYSHLKEKIGLVDPKVLPTVLLVYNNLRVHKRRVKAQIKFISENWYNNVLDGNVTKPRYKLEEEQLKRMHSFCSLGVMKLNEELRISISDKLKKDAELAQKEIEQSEI